MFHNKQHLFQWLTDNLSDRVLQNLLQGGGQAELLGGFSPLPGSTKPGWIVALTSYRTGKVYYVCVGVSEAGKAHWWRAKGVQWENWDGGGAIKTLYRGDDPEKYKRLKYEKETPSSQFHPPQRHPGPNC